MLDASIVFPYPRGWKISLEFPSAFNEGKGVTMRRSLPLCLDEGGGLVPLSGRRPTPLGFRPWGGGPEVGLPTQATHTVGPGPRGRACPMVFVAV